MAGRKQKAVWLLSILYIACASSKTSKDDLDGAEANGKLEIIKQIKKVNDDGSYTIGYEADDGSFKIESRDVLGNIKGTYGYLDEDGEIKRVSYTTNNSSEIVTKPETASVVQRIPKINKTSTTRRPTIVYNTLTTQSTPTTTTVIQTIPRRRITTTTQPPTTTTDSSYSDFIKAAVQASKSLTTKSSLIYDHSAPARILLQSRPIVRTAGLGHEEPQKSEGQLIRPDVSIRPTEAPIYRRPLEATLLDSETKPVAEEPESRGNLLRRQLIPEKTSYDPKQQLLNLQQSSDGDVIDVYSASVTTGTPRPLFTTARPRYLSSTVAPTIQRPTIRYPSSYQKTPKETSEYAQETTTAENIDVQDTTPNPLPVVQIPANREAQEPLVAIQHPVHGRTILVPLSHLQGRFVQSSGEQEQQYVDVVPNEQFLKETSPVQQNFPAPLPIPVYLRRYPPPQRFRPIPVQVDEDGYIREMPQYVNPTTPYPVEVRVTPSTVPTYAEGGNDVDLIKPPVSTRDFQKLLEQLIVRQSRLEQINTLARRYQQPYDQPYRPAYQPIFSRRPAEDQRYVHSGKNAYLPQTQAAHQPSVIVRPEQESQQNLYNQDQYSSSFAPTPASFLPTRRVARLLPPRQQHEVDNTGEDDYLPPEVREMLLLRMLQLAINPGLPLDVPEHFGESTTTVSRHKKTAVRNVEILGEEDDPKNSRSKR